MSIKVKWLTFGLGALFSATFLWPIVGLFQGYFHSRESSHQWPDWRLMKVAEQFRPDWIPHGGHMLVPVWPAPDAAHDKGCLDKLSSRESVAETVQKTPGEPWVREAIGRSLWLRRDEILEPFELNAIHKQFPVSFGAVNGCIEGSLAAPLCKRLLRRGMIDEYNLGRTQLEKALQEAINGAEMTACKVMEVDGPLTKPLSWPTHLKDN